MVDPEPRLAQPSRRKQGGHDLFCDGSLQGRAAPAALAGAANLQVHCQF